MAKKVGFSESEPLETRYEYSYDAVLKGTDENEDDDDASTQAFLNFKQESFLSERDRDEAMAAERLSMRLLSVPDDDEEQQDRILRESLALVSFTPEELEDRQRKSIAAQKDAGGRFWTMIGMLVVGCILLGVAFYVGAKMIGPPSQPLGPYELVERQVCTYMYIYI